MSSQSALKLYLISTDGWIRWGFGGYEFRHLRRQSSESGLVVASRLEPTMRSNNSILPPAIITLMSQLGNRHSESSIDDKHER